MFIRAIVNMGMVTAMCLAFGACAGEAPSQSSAGGDPTVKGGKAAKGDDAGEHDAPGQPTEGGAAAEHDAHAHHDPYDLSHANATKSLTNPIVVKADMAIYTFIVFLVLLAVLTKFAWGPIARGLEAREKGIAEKIEQARMAAEQASEQLKQYEAKLAAATAEAQQIVAKARQDADAAAAKLLAEAQAAAAKERERAVADIGAAKNQALREIAERSVDTAITLARSIIRREVRPADHEQLIKDALKQFPSTGSLN